MTKLLYWLAAPIIIAVVGFSEHAVPAASEAIHTPVPITEAAPDVNQEALYQDMYRYVTDDQMMTGNICIEARHKECEAYR